MFFGLKGTVAGFGSGLTNSSAGSSVTRGPRGEVGDLGDNGDVGPFPSGFSGI